jgi:uncharacterized protein (DUF1684 family)
MERNEYLQLADWRRRTAQIYERWRDESPVDPEGAALRLRQARGDLFHHHPQSPLPIEGRSRFGGISYWAYDPAYRMRVSVEPADVEPAAAAGPAADEPPDAGGGGRDEGGGGEGGAFSLSSAYRSAATVSGLHWPTSLNLRPSAVPEAPPIELPASGDEPFSFRRIGRVRLAGPLAGETLAVFWMEGYAGGLFIPFRDSTSGRETYGAGRYLLDTAKGADHGGDQSSGDLLLDFNLAYHPSCVYDPRWNCPLAPAENTIGEAVRVGERLV